MSSDMKLKILTAVLGVLVTATILIYYLTLRM